MAHGTRQEGEPLLPLPRRGHLEHGAAAAEAAGAGARPAADLLPPPHRDTPRLQPHGLQADM